MENLLKIGYFRRIDTSGNQSYISYKEFYSYEEEHRKYLKKSNDDGHCKLYCACSMENNLELSITANHVIRVKNNNQQSMHKDSCPKSIHYAQWNNENAEKGVFSNEDQQVVFNIALPSVVKSTSTSTGSSSSESAADPNKQRVNILNMAIALNKMAWEIQTFSKRKEIKEAHQANQPVTWSYKTNEEFIRLIFGISNRIYARCRGDIVPFIELCYRKDLFYKCDDWKKQWFIYAEIEKVSEIKKERKYQYITVKMPSDKSPRKAVIRIDTEQYDKIFDGFEEKEGMHRILTGYVSRKSFSNEDGSKSEWINFIKGVVLYVSENGLYVENEEIAKAANHMAKHRVIFKRPYAPLENYGSETPTFLVERLHKKDIIFDFPATDRQYAKRSAYAENNSEYDCHLFTEGEDFIRNYMDILKAQ